MVTLQEEELVLMKTRDTIKERVICDSCDKPITGEVNEVRYTKPLSKTDGYLYFHAMPRECAEADDIHVIPSHRQEIVGAKLA